MSMICNTFSDFELVYATSARPQLAVFGDISCMGSCDELAKAAGWAETAETGWMRRRDQEKGGEKMKEDGE